MLKTSAFKAKVSGMRKLVLHAAACAAAAMAAPSAALADKEIVSSPGNRYDAATYTMDQGERLTLRNADPFVRHDVVSVAPGDVKGRYLFASDTIGQGTSFVEGSQYLTSGEYDFYCSIHESEMRAKLVVTTAGAPAPRPGPGPAPGPGPSPAPADTTAPVPTIRAGRLVASKLVSRRVLVLTVGADEASQLVVGVRVGSRRIAGAKLSLGSAGTQKIEIPLGRTARRSIRRGKVLTAVISATDAAANQGTAKLTRRLG